MGSAQGPPESTAPRSHSVRGQAVADSEALRIRPDRARVSGPSRAEKHRRGSARTDQQSFSSREIYGYRAWTGAAVRGWPDGCAPIDVPGTDKPTGPALTRRAPIGAWWLRRDSCRPGWDSFPRCRVPALPTRQARTVRTLTFSAASPEAPKCTERRRIAN